MTQKSYRSKTFTDFTHSMSEIISGMCNNGIVITGLQEFDYDISGGFENISKQGFPLSVIIEGKRGSAYIKCKERNTVYEQNIQCTGQTGSI